jgi:hypothetical protein
MEVDKEKYQNTINVVASMNIPKIVPVLVIHDTDFVWLQFYTCMFLERKTILVCDIKQKKALNKHMTKEHKKYIYKIIYVTDFTQDTFLNELTTALNELQNEMKNGN